MSDNVRKYKYNKFRICIHITMPLNTHMFSCSYSYAYLMLEHSHLLTHHEIKLICFYRKFTVKKIEKLFNISDHFVPFKLA